MNINDLFSPNLIDIDVNINQQEELFSYVSTRLKELNLITDEFLPQIIAREKAYPTGLMTTSGAVAIPHTDPEYVKESFIYVIKVKDTIPFREMGSYLEDQAYIAPTIIFVIGFKQGDLQLEILKSLINLFGQTDKMSEIKQAQKPVDLYQLLQLYVTP